MPDKCCRAGVTNLTDAELSLLDQAVWKPGTRAVYRMASFSWQYNRTCHCLSDSKLNETLDRFEMRGWTTGRNISTSWSATDRTVELTQKGGQLWESERLPDWSRYVIDSGGARTFDEPTRHSVLIYGHSPTIVREFYDIGRECKFFGIQASEVRTASALRSWIYWRPPQRLYLLASWIESYNNHVDWDNMEALRTWWRFPDEISKLWGLPPA